MGLGEIRRIRALFAKASRIRKNESFKSDERQYIGLENRREDDGIKRFKRRALGLCGRKTTKSLDEIAQILVDIGIVSSMQEGKDLVPSLSGLRLEYGNEFFTLCNYIDILPKLNSSGNYEISRGDFDGVYP